MDNNTSGVLGIIALVVSVGGSIVAVLNHKRVKSTCCGRTIDASFDVENTTPTQPKISSVPPAE
jgi:hypothetical protein